MVFYVHIYFSQNGNGPGCYYELKGGVGELAAG